MELLSGCECRNVDDLELHTVRVEEEHRVIPRQVAVFLRLALEHGVRAAQPLGALVDDGARRRLEGEVVEADGVAVDLVAARLRLAQADRRLAAAQVPDRLAALALDLADPVPAERPEQLAVEGQAALDRGDDEVDVVDASGAHDRRGCFDAWIGGPSYHAAGAALPLSPRHEPRPRGRGALHRQARVRPRRAARPDRRGADLLRARRLVGRA